MKLYSHYGLNDFVICAGYRGYMIKEYFANYVLHASDVTVDLRTNSITYHKGDAEPWRVTIIDTGEYTQTGGRLKRIAHHLDPNEPFCMTYGDGVRDINVADLIDFHRRMGVEATVTAVHLPGRFGSLDIGESKVAHFAEKPPGDGGMINGGFFVLNPGVLDRIENDATVWEKSPLEGLARDGQLAAYDMMVSGSPWIRCVTNNCWIVCGRRVSRPGKSGREPDAPQAASSAGFAMRR